MGFEPKRAIRLKPSIVANKLGVNIVYHVHILLVILVYMDTYKLRNAI
jgi:hypothetical protein